MLNKKKVKLITNGDNEIKSDVKKELKHVIENDETFLKRFEYLLAVHNEKLIAKDLVVNKNVQEVVMKYDLVVDYEELTKDKVVGILIINVPSSSFQISLVETLISIVNIFSPVKFKVEMESV